MTAQEAPRYRLGPRSTRGLIAGWRGGQIVTVAVSALLALGALRAEQGFGGAMLAFLVAAAGVAVATWPIGGHPIEAWLPTVVRYGLSSRARHRGSATLRLPPTSGAHARRKGSGKTRRASGRGVRREGELGLLTLVPASGLAGVGSSARSRDFGVLADAARGTYSAVLPVGSSGFALLDDHGRAGAVAAWSGVLAAMAAESRVMKRLQWIARTFPSGGGSADRPSHRSPAAESYHRLVTEVAPQLWSREVFVVVTTGEDRGFGGLRTRRQPLTCATSEVSRRLSSLLGSLAERLNGAGLVSGAPLDVEGLAVMLRRAHAIEPAEAGGVEGPWPPQDGVEARWKLLRTGGTFQATYWIAEWPRGEVGPGVLLPLLVGGAERRTVAMTMAPLPPLRAVRRAERERTAGAADAELRNRHGFSLTARARAEQEARLQREAELAEGHAAYLFSGYVSVTACDEGELEASCRAVEQSAALAQLELRRLYGAQEEAWCRTLPTGRGC
jgi:hypothetical protein